MRAHLGGLVDVVQKDTGKEAEVVHDARNVDAARERHRFALIARLAPPVHPSVSRRR